MKLTKFTQPQFIETLVFAMDPAFVPAYLDLDEEIWVRELAKLPGFCGSETWVSEQNPGEITSHYFWESRAAFEGIDPAWLAGNKARMHAATGANEVRFVRAGHVESPCCRIRAFC